MKTGDDCLLMAFCRGKVITQVKFPALDKFHGLGFACDLGMEISELKADAKGLVVRILHGAETGSASA